MDVDSLTPAAKQRTEVSWEKIDRMDWQLWLSAILLIFVLGIGLLSFVFPTVFWSSGVTLLRAPERAFYGLSLLLGITLAYLLQKQAKLRELKHQRWEEKLVHDAFHDVLTDLPNRALLLDRLRISLARAKRHKEYQFGVIFIDLDRFKLINDSMGHPTGDKVLVETARRLQRCLRTEDTVARLGGDEFAILLEDVRHMNDVSHTIERIRKSLLAPIDLEGKEIFTGASMGIALSSMGYEKAEDLIRDSDTAMYRAKARGTGQHEVFDASMHEHAVHLLDMETDLRGALDRQELVLHYQPIVWLRTGQVTGLEALVRWRHPTRGLLSPGEFLPIAEATGMMVPITQLVLQQVCQQVNQWQSDCPSSWPLSVSVNLPAKYLTRKDHVEKIITIISEHGTRPQKIRLEITEDQLMGNAAATQQTLLNLREFGVRVYIDDFGTGFSSLSYLSTFPVDALKIDQSFVRSMNGRDKNSAIVRSIITLGHNLGIDVIAEGIETADQLNFLRAAKCQYGQGYYFAQPMDAEKVSKTLAKWFPANQDKKEIAARLANFALFAEMDSEDILEIAQTCEEVCVPPGTIVIHEGQVGDFTYLLEEGTVELDGHGEDQPGFPIVREAPSLLGEMALLNSEEIETVGVKALTEVRMISVSIIQCLSYLRRFPILQRNFSRLVAKNLVPERPSQP